MLLEFARVSKLDLTAAAEHRRIRNDLDSLNWVLDNCAHYCSEVATRHLPDKRRHLSGPARPWKPSHRNSRID